MSIAAATGGPETGTVVMVSSRVVTLVRLPPVTARLTPPATKHARMAQMQIGRMTKINTVRAINAKIVATASSLK